MDMVIVLGILAVAALGGIIYLFLSPKSSKVLKFTALGALVLSGIAILVCGFVLVFGSPDEKTDPYAFPLAVGGAPQSGPKTNVVELTIFLVVLLLILGIIVLLGFRNQKKRTAKKTPDEKDDMDFSTDEF